MQQTFIVDTTTDSEFELESPNAEGDYRARIQIGTNGPPDNLLTCVEVFLALYRIWTHNDYRLLRKQYRIKV